MGASQGFGRGVALLRGINVGRAKRIAMVELRALFAELGFTDVHTVLNSGNVVFTSRAHDADGAAALIEAALVERLGVASRVTVLDAAALATLVDHNQLAAVCEDHARLLAFTLAGAPQRALLAPLAARDWGEDRLHLADKSAYVACPGGVLDSKLAMTVTRLLGESTTSRNWNTILKLHALCNGG
jgi:uncharacterized protein (DUF1697 family)